MLSPLRLYPVLAAAFLALLPTGPRVLAAPPPKGSSLADSSPAARAYLRTVRNHIGEAFQSKASRNIAMAVRGGGYATARFFVQSDGRVTDLRFENLSPRGGNNVAYWARQSILEAERRLRPFSPELAKQVTSLNVSYSFSVGGLRPSSAAGHGDF